MPNSKDGKFTLSGVQTTLYVYDAVNVELNLEFSIIFVLFILYNFLSKRFFFVPAWSFLIGIDVLPKRNVFELPEQKFIKIL